MPLGAWKPATGDAISRGLVSAMEMELGENTFHVILDCVLADYETLGDLNIGEARHHQFKHIHFSDSELFSGPEGLRLALNLFEDSGSHAP